MRPLFALFLMPACAWISDAELDARRDRDGDGAISDQWGGPDCDDRKASVNPDATEVCDGVDNNCDDEVDNVEAPEGSAWYLDDDGDGWGDLATEVWACSLPSARHVDRADDCDDTNAQINPEALEVCNEVDDDCDALVDQEDPDLPTVDIFGDADGDGYGDDATVRQEQACPGDGESLKGGDCDDTNEDISPGALETCNGIDDDCDELVDDQDVVDDGLSWYADTDRDTYGDPDSVVVACEPPFAHVADNTDCDDASASIHPFANEVCNGLDDNCNGVVDDSAVDQATWYEDGDGDGYGHADKTAKACDKPDGYAASKTDCDDTDEFAYPGAPEDCESGIDSNCDGFVGNSDNDGDGSSACEDCDDGNNAVYPGADEVCNGVDDNCDGKIDDDDPLLDASTASTWYEDADGDGYGESSTAAITCEAPSGYLDLDGDCDDSDASVNPDAVEYCNDGLDRDCDGSSTDCEHDLASLALELRGSSNSAGTTVSGTADLDGDGVYEVVVGAPGGTSGRLYVLTGPNSSAANLSSGATWTGSTGDEAGASLSTPGDSDGDGLDDVLVGGPGAEEAYLLFGPITASGTLRSADVLFESSDSGDAFATAVAGGNLDGNAWADLVITSPEGGSGLSSGEGRAYVFEGPLTGGSTLGADDGSAEIVGGSLNLALGGAAGIVDTDADGTGELVVQGLTTVLTGVGGVYIFDRPSGSMDVTDADAKISGTTSLKDVGTAITGGDLDGDGKAELVLGGADSGTGGRVWIFTGPVTSNKGIAAATWTLSGASGDEAGTSLLVVEDLDGDGIDDLLIGAPGGETTALFLGGSLSGTATLSDADASFIGESAGDGAGTSVSGGKDLDGDGEGDLLIGSPEHDGNGTAYLFSGAGF